ncbi:LysR family transcriptional regulator [Pokkaliibacter plantistimulans]|uniref:LysR family transcriptional regulator n=1 Tax=Pokkaliibacter plantistimulans TaxID=1635171 RepID=A0ABX5LUD5_9GAMM|nr:LysR family transcriptional regulator [Pokkaliibacter plantistimulans]PXF30274.1 LysR family transcriptional regulator [Pokkaliibacter plantistimulans]
MKIQQLKAFLTITEVGSLQEASRRLHLTQPALSKSIKELESELGISLFIRGARGITITEYGQRLLGHARLIVETEKRARQDIEDMKGMMVSEVVLGVTPITSVLRPLADGIVAFRQQHPGVTLRVLEMRPYQLLEHLREGRVDFAITSQVPAVGHALEWIPICRIPNLVAVRRGHPLQGVKSLRVLQQGDWISLDPLSDQTTYFHQMFSMNGLPLPLKVQECSSMTLARTLVNTTDVIALYTKEAFDSPDLSHEISAVPIIEPVPDSVISLVTPKRDLLTLSATQLFDMIQSKLQLRYPHFT